MGKNRALNLLLALFSIVFVLLGTEVFFRYSGLWQKASYEQRRFFCASGLPKVPYLLRPGTKTIWAGADIVINAEGLREYEDITQAAQKTRILCLGDSITFGLGVDQKKTYPEQLQSMLNERGDGREYEVINGGISGFSAMDAAAYLPRLIEICRPDLILWMVVENDYDDSLGVNEKGQMIHGISGYSATSYFLESAWGITGTCFCPDRIFDAMDMEHQFWAMEKKPPVRFSGAVDDLFQTYSFAYSFLKARMGGPGRSGEPDDLDNCSSGCIHRSRPVINNGIADLLPEIPSIVLSPYYGSRFYDALKTGAETAAAAKIPMVLLSLNMLVDGVQEGTSDLYVRDITEYLGIPFGDFRYRYNLGWDGHLNPEGNRKLAQAVLSCLSDLGVYQSTVPEKKNLYPKKEYWEEYRKEKSARIRLLKPFIDFNNYRQINQVVGGIYPPCKIPIKKKAKLSVILGNLQKDRIVFSGTNSSGKQQFLVYAGDNDDFAEQVIDIPPGAFTQTIMIPENISENRIIDLQITPVSDAEENCVKVDYIGESPGL